jgi:hypothetical protein
LPDDIALDSSQPEKAGERESPSQEQPSIDAELLAEQPPVKHFLDVMIGAFSARVGARNPLLDKLNPEQIDKYLDYGRESERDEFSLRKSNRWFSAGYVGLGVAVFVFLVIYLAPSRPDLLGDIFKLAFGFIGGLGVGLRMGRKSAD